jgi:CHASE3 domain sensor protein
MNEYNDFENIERYLEGKMQSEELAAFEKVLTDENRPGGGNSPNVSAGDYKAAVNAIKVYNRDLLKDRLKQIHKDVAIQSAATRKLRRWYLAAAVILVLLSVGVAAVI